VSKSKKAPNGLGSVNGHIFENVLLLLISILHGALFLIVCENGLAVIKNFSHLQLSILFLQFAVFFRVLQTYVLAAFSYGSMWEIDPFDIFIVFITVAFEYALFKVDTYTEKQIKAISLLVVFFSASGALTYYNAYRKVTKTCDKKLVKKERIIQLINITTLIVIFILYFIPMIIESGPRHVAELYIIIANYFASGILVANIYSSIKLTLSPLHDP